MCPYSVVVKKLKHVYISPTLYDSVSGQWLHLPGNCPVFDPYGLSVTLPVLSHTVTSLSGNTCRPVLVQYQDLQTVREHYLTVLKNQIGLSADEICDYIRQVGLCKASSGIWHLTDYIWQCFKNRSFFFYNCLGKF